MKNDCFSFIKFCNERIANSNDYNIIQNVFKYIGKKHSLLLMN